MLWTIVRAHQSDIGGATHGAYNPAATEIWQEGLRIPPILLYERGRLRPDILEMLAINVRHARDFRGDLAAMVGAAHLGERGLERLCDEFGASLVGEAIEAMLDAAERRARAPSSRAGRMACTPARPCSTTMAAAGRTSASARRSRSAA